MFKYVPVPVLLLLAILTSVTLGAEPATSPIPVPPALQALEQKTLLIHFNTARLSGIFAFGELGPPVEEAELGAAANKCKSFVSYTTATERISPPGFTGASQINDGPAVKQIDIGKTLYIYTPSAARYDGGRPWVRQTPATKSSSDPALSALSTLSEDQPTTSTGFFQRMIEEINDSSSVQEIGLRTIDGQQATEFTATVPMARLLASRLSQKQIDAAKKGNKLFSHLAEAIVTIELYFTANGMPIRTIDVIGPRKEGVGVEQDILATGGAVSINRPPARLTIKQTRLERREKQYDKRHPRHPVAPQDPFGPGLARCPSESSRGPLLRRSAPNRQAAPQSMPTGI